MNEQTSLAVLIPDDQARVNVTYGGANGELPDTVFFEAGDADVKGWVTEAVRNGGIPGIAAAIADFSNFVVDRFVATEVRPYNLIQLRPKTPFGIRRVKDTAPSREVTAVDRGDYVKVGGRLEKIASNTAFGSEHTPRSWTVTTEEGRTYGMFEIERYAKAEDVE